MDIRFAAIYFQKMDVKMDRGRKYGNEYTIDRNEAFEKIF